MALTSSTLQRVTLEHQGITHIGYMYIVCNLGITNNIAGRIGIIFKGPTSFQKLCPSSTRENHVHSVFRRAQISISCMLFVLICHI